MNTKNNKLKYHPPFSRLGVDGWEVHGEEHGYGERPTEFFDYEIRGDGSDEYELITKAGSRDTWYVCVGSLVEMERVLLNIAKNGGSLEHIDLEEGL